MHLTFVLERRVFNFCIQQTHIFLSVKTLCLQVPHHLAKGGAGGLSDVHQELYHPNHLIQILWSDAKSRTLQCYVLLTTFAVSFSLTNSRCLQCFLEVISSDAPIPLFYYRSDTKYILAENGRYRSDTDTLPDRHYAHKKFLLLVNFTSTLKIYKFKKGSRDQ